MINLDGLPELMTTAQMAKLCGVKTRAVQLWRKRGVYVGGHRVYLEANKVGQRLRVTREAYIEFLRQCNLDTWREAAEQQRGKR